MKKWDNKLFSLFVESYASFRQLRRLPSNQNSIRQFKAFLGIPEDHDIMKCVHNENALHKMKWLAGPNAEIMYKIWRAQNEQK